MNHKSMLMKAGLLSVLVGMNVALKAVAAETFIGASNFVPSGYTITSKGREV